MPRRPQEENKMDMFDQYLRELTRQYVKTNLSNDDYEEIYVRFDNIDYISEVCPCLLTMRFLA